MKKSKKTSSIFDYVCEGQVSFTDPASFASYIEEYTRYGKEQKDADNRNK